MCINAMLGWNAYRKARSAVTCSTSFSGSNVLAHASLPRALQVGGIRRIVVPQEIGYPDDNWRSKGPKPSTFAGERALGFVLENRGMIDKTLLFDIELKNVIKKQ